MNVYVALLEKIEVLSAGCFNQPKKLAESQMDWITLGHFDAMHIYSLNLSGQNLFQAIQKNNETISSLQCVERYYSPLYMISQEDISSFLEKRRPFFAVLKLHFVDSVETEGAYQQIQEKLPDHAKEFGCLYRVFRTIELSDLILAVTSHELCQLLNFDLTLRKFDGIGKVYSYVGVDYQSLQDENWQPDDTDKIALFSMRFSVRDFVQATSVVNNIKGELGDQPAFSVSGVDDIVVNWQDLQTAKLIQLYRKWFLASGDPSTFSSDCFAEITTRVGIPLQMMEVTEKQKQTDSGRLEQLEKKCKILHERCVQVCSLISEKGQSYNWTRPLSTLTSTLIRISKTSVLDEFVYIMYAGVEAFLQNIESRLPDFSRLNIANCQDFVENWAHLMEHVMRVEGQLTHNPQMRPILYDIPVAMLEYVLTFLERVSKVLQAADEFNKKDICFLLVPRLCDRIKAREMFPADPVRRLPGLVLVRIPLQMLYDPKTIQLQLSHEVSHFVGEVYRDREGRRKRYIEASSALMARVIFGDEYHVLARTIQQELNQYTSELTNANIRQLSGKIMQWVSELYSDEKSYLKFMRTLFLNCKETESLKIDPSRSFFTRDNIQIFQELLFKDLKNLFREIYADICMLHLLGAEVTDEDHVEGMIKELHSEPREDKRHYEQFAIRIYVGLVASKRNIPWEYIESHDQKLCEKLQLIDTHVKDKRRSQDLMIPVTSIIHLLKYAEKCYEKLSKKEQDGLKEIRLMFRNVISSAMDYSRFIQDINKYRVTILG